MRLKTAVYRVLARPAVQRARLRWQERSGRDGLAILMLHGVYDAEMARRLPPPRSSVSVDSLAANLRALAGVFHVVSLDEAVAMLTGTAPWRRRCVVLTFDDSLKCLARLAVPLLRQLGLTATFFISTEAICSQQPYWWRRLEYAVSRSRRSRAAVRLPDGREWTLHPGDCKPELSALKAALKEVSAAERTAVVSSVEDQLGVSLLAEPAADPHAEILTWDEVRTMQAAGMSIGSHTVSHPNLTRCSEVELRFELEASRAAIEKELGRPCRHVCYPYGLFDERTRCAARAAGFVSGVTTEAPGWNHVGGDVFALRRFAVPAVPFELPHVLCRRTAGADAEV